MTSRFFVSGATFSHPDIGLCAFQRAGAGVEAGGGEQDEGGIRREGQTNDQESRAATGGNP